jgi:transcriptional regulator with XRE-family HTH domain
MPTGAPVTYVSGGHTDHDHLGLPRADIGYRGPHAQRERRPAGLDWDALAPTCAGCGTKSGTVNTTTGLCRTCAPVVKPKELPAEGKQGRHTPRRSAPRQVRPAAPRVVPATPAPPPPQTPAATQETRPVVAAGTLDTFQALRHQLAEAVAALDCFLATYPAAQVLAPSTESPRPRRVIDRDTDTPRRQPGARSPRRDKITLDAAAVAAGYAAGKSLIELAEEFGVSHPVISRHLDEQGIPRRRARVTYTDDLIDQVRRLYVDEHLTQQQVADRLGLTLKVIQTAMERGQIEARESASALSQRGIGHVSKIPRDQHQSIVDRYRAGEPAPAIARDFDVTPSSIYPILDAHGITERHGHRSTPGHDGAAGLKARIRSLAVPVSDIKAWAVRQGLLEMVGPGLPPARVVDAYVEAHPSLDTQEATA